MNNELLIKEGESLDSYAMRLYFTEKPKHNLSKHEIARLLNEHTGLNKDESAWRKHYASFRKGYELGCTTSVDQEVEEIKQATLEFDKARIKLQSERVLINRKKRVISRTEAIYEQILDHMDELKLQKRNVIPLADDNLGCVFAISDLHVGSMDDDNNHQTLLERLDKVLAKGIAEIKMMNVKKVDLLICGDVIDGLLRTSQLRKLEFLIGKQLVKAVDTLAMFINELAEYGLQVDVHMTTFGNHSQLRHFGTGRNEMDEDDLEFVIREMLDRLFIDDERVNIVSYDDLVEFEVCGNSILALHGSEYDKKINESFVKDISYNRNKKYDVVYTGHFHSFAVRTVCESDNSSVELVNIPAMTFTNDYAKRKLLSSPSGGIIDFYNEDGIKKTVRVYA